MFTTKYEAMISEEAPTSGNGHYTTHIEAIARKKLISDVKYNVTLALDASTSFFGQAVITFNIQNFKNLKKEDHQYLFLNFTNGDLIWMNEDVIINVGDIPVVVPAVDVFYNNRINLAPAMDQISMFVVPKTGDNDNS